MRQHPLRCKTNRSQAAEPGHRQNQVRPGRITRPKTMNRKFTSFTLLVGLSTALQAAIPSPEKLLPADTVGVVSVPDYAKARAAYEANASSRLWRDPAMKPFTEKLMNKVKEEFIVPLERQLGVKFADYNGLAQGQFTFAVTQNGWQGGPSPLPAWLLLVDAKDKSGQLKTNLAELKKRWLDAGKTLSTEKIRDVEFTTLMVSGEEITRTLEKSLSDSKTDKAETSEGKKSGSKLGITVGQSDSLLIAASDPKVIEKILILQSGGSTPALGEQAAFNADYQARLRNALVYGWVHFKPIGDALNRAASEAARKDSDGDSGLNWSKILAASGLTGLKTVSGILNESPDGSTGELYLGVPAASRAGLFKIFVAESKDTTPPPFVSADAVKYQRWRLDIPKAWAALENMLMQISPQMAGGLKFIMDSAGKDKDPNFDLKRELIGNLGDDIISYQRKPRGNTFADLNSPPSLYLVGSPNAEKVVTALKSLVSLLTGAGNPPKEREFLGRKIYTLALPSMPSPDGSSGAPRNLSYAAGAGYVAMSTDEAMLENFLRSSESSGKALRETAGLADAAQKIGGMSTGLFGYENASETMRGILEALKNDSSSLEKMLGMMPLPPKFSAKDGKGLKDWLDFSLLPPFDQISKYFYFTVYAGSANADGLSYRMFSPTPPQLKN